MPLPSLSWIAKVGEAAIRFIFMTSPVVAFFALFFKLGDSMVAAVLNYALAQINAMDTTAFSNASFASVVGISYANAVFPLSEAISIWTALGTACGIVVVIRWIKSFIPTVSN